MNLSEEPNIIQANRFGRQTGGVPKELIRSHGAEPVESLDQLFDSQPEILVELEALTPQSVGFVKESHLRALRPDSLFVNSGRGAVVDEAVLERIAVEGRLRLALDVFAVEPPPRTSPLRSPSRVTLMPHVSGPGNIATRIAISRLASGSRCDPRDTTIFFLNWTNRYQYAGAAQRGDI